MNETDKVAGVLVEWWRDCEEERTPVKVRMFDLAQVIRKALPTAGLGGGGDGDGSSSGGDSSSSSGGSMLNELWAVALGSDGADLHFDTTYAVTVRLVGTKWTGPPSPLAKGKCMSCRKLKARHGQGHDECLLAKPVAPVLMQPPRGVAGCDGTCLSVFWSPPRVPAPNGSPRRGAPGLQTRREGGNLREPPAPPPLPRTPPRRPPWPR